MLIWVGRSQTAFLSIVLLACMVACTEGSSKSTTTTPSCMSAKAFNYRAGACVTGTGPTETFAQLASAGVVIDIGPFTTPDSWSASLSLSGKSDAGMDCANISTNVGAADLAGGKIDASLNLGTTASAPSNPQAEWHFLVASPISGLQGCSWSVKFS